MDFAKKMMKSMGWKEGDGLGKERQGMTEAIKPSVKLNTHGLGHDASKEFTFNWWEHVYDTAAKNVDVEDTGDGVRMKKKRKKFAISTTLGARLIDEEEEEEPEIPRKKKKKAAKEEKSDVVYSSFVKSGNDVEEAPVMKKLSDEELLEACGGLTAHKAARHGHRLSGKLQRLEAHEAKLVEISFTNSGKIKKKLKKKKKEKANSKDVEES